jgi:alanyl-tRNA synthetase
MVTIWDLDGNLIDAQACGGLHVDGKESMLGMVRIISTSRPHDGVDRMEFVAGLASLDTVNNEEKTLKNIANLSGLDMDKLNDGIRDRMEELQRARRESKKLADDFGRAMKPGQEIVIKEMDYSRQTLRAIATAFIEENPSHAIILTSKKGEVVCIAGHKSGKNALNVVKEHFSKNGKNFIGGGAAKMAEGNVS